MRRGDTVTDQHLLSSVRSDRHQQLD